MSDSTENTVQIVTFPEFVLKTQELVSENKYAEAAEFSFGLYQAVLEDFRANKDSDKPSIKKAAEAFEYTDETEEVANEVMGQVRALVHSAVTENPEVSVLLYNQMKDYAQDHVKVYRDAVLRGYMNEVDDDADSSEYELPLTREELNKVRTMVESFANFADMMDDRKPEIPVKKSGSFQFANPRGYGEDGDAVTSSDEGTAKFVYILDGEELDARETANVALYHLSTPDRTYTASDIWKLVREQHGNKPRTEGWKIEVNGHILEAKPVGN